MMSHSRRGSGPVRQHSLQQVPRRHHQVRRQRSAEEDRSFQIRTIDPIRARRDCERTSGIERPKVRIAWGNDQARISTEEDPDSGVEVVACQIGTGKSRPLANARQPRMIGQSSGADKSCSTLLYSRQELAERLRLAWKQREANRSNIDVFLAQGTIEERSDSRLSSCSSVDRSPARLSLRADRNVDKTMIDTKCEKSEEAASNVVAKGMDTNESRMNLQRSILSLTQIDNPISTPTLCGGDCATNKRAGFKNATNTAFLKLDNDPGGEISSSPVTTFPIIKEAENLSQNPGGSTTVQKNRRTNSAPPQRRAKSVGPAGRTQVSIVIDAPTLCKSSQETTVMAASSNELGNCTGKLNAFGGRPSKSAPTKKRSKTGKKKAAPVADNGRAKVEGSESKNMEVVTMVSLVSDADSDSEVEDNSPRDDKLINQLRSNLPTTPIIKNNVTACCSFSSISRRPIKSVSFQQDSIDVEETEKKTSRIRPQSVQVGRVTGSALPTPEEARTWRTEVTTLAISNISGRQHYETQEITEISLTDREKRCLIVPIGDPRSDKKRKLLRTRSTPSPKVNDAEKSSTVHPPETREMPSVTRVSEPVGKFQPAQNSTSFLVQASVSKLGENVAATRAESEPEPDDDSVDPSFRTTKEKECWHLYRRMCDKGVCVSFDTVLRGMLTPTEYRLRRKEMTQRDLNVV